MPAIGLQLCVNSQLLGISSKEMWLKVLLSWYFIVKNTKLWSFSIKFGELRYNNVTNTFMIKRDFAWIRLSVTHTIGTPCHRGRLWKIDSFKIFKLHPRKYWWFWMFVYWVKTISLHFYGKYWIVYFLQMFRFMWRSHMYLQKRTFWWIMSEW